MSYDIPSWNIQLKNALDHAFGKILGYYISFQKMPPNERLPKVMHYIFRRLQPFYLKKVLSWTPCISKIKFFQDVGKRRRNLFTFTDQRKTQFLLMWKSGWNLFVKQNHYYFLNNRQERHFLTLSLNFFLWTFFCSRLFFSMITVQWMMLVIMVRKKRPLRML